MCSDTIDTRKSNFIGCDEKHFGGLCLRTYFPTLSNCNHVSIIIALNGIHILFIL